VLAASARLPADVSGARVPSDADLYLPIEYDGAFDAATATRRRSNYLGVLGRAQPGMSSAAVDEDLNRIGTELQALFPDTNAGLTMNAVSARELIVGDVRRPLLMLLGAVGFVLLVACSNVASLVLARASAREDELAVRAALGAGRGRLLRQLLTEALVLGLIGGAIGLTLAYAGTRALVAAQPTDIPRLNEVGLDLTVVFFTFGIALLASLAFGAFPALQATGHLARGLRAGGHIGGVDRRARRMRAGLVIAEVALAVVLLTGAGLLFRSLVALAEVAPGFDAGHAISFRFALFGHGYDPARVRTRVEEIEAALRAIPGVSGVAATTVLPLSGPGQRMAFSVVGAPPPAADINPEIGVTSVTPEYFRTIGAVLVRGRDLTDRDRGGAAPVAIVNDAAVRRWFAGADPIGARVRASGACEPTGACEIVGVIRDVLQGDPRQQPAPQLFVPHAQRAARSIWIVLRSQGDPLALAPSIRATIHGLDQDLALSDFTALDRLHAGAIARPRFYTALLVLFAGLALVLAVTGILGVTSYTVAERTREIGIRMALGAQRHDILRLIVGGTLALAAAGIVLGLAVALAVGRVIRSQLFGVEVLDPPTFVFVMVTLLSSATVAAFLPARRAARVDPVSTLRLGAR
jgi:predicted permease